MCDIEMCKTYLFILVYCIRSLDLEIHYHVSQEGLSFIVEVSSSDHVVNRHT